MFYVMLNILRRFPTNNVKRAFIRATRDVGTLWETDLQWFILTSFG